MIQAFSKKSNNPRASLLLPKGLAHVEAVEELFNSASAYFDSMIEDISKAKKCIDLEVYIFGMGKVGQKFRTALCQAAARGVQVRVHVDGAGTPWWGRSFASEMEKSGVQTRVFHPFPWQLWNWSRSKVKASSLIKFIYLCFTANSRNHRKVVLIDHDTAYLGSINITLQHLSREEGGQGWRDIAIRLKGAKPVAQLREAFEIAWSHQTIKERITHVFTMIKSQPLIRLNHNRHRRRVLYKQLLWQIQDAHERIWITNAYFIPDSRFLKYLKHAASRGVDVRMLLPSKSDVPFMPWASAVFYDSLLKAGVRIFEYLPGVLHAKTFIVDDWMLLGSSNLNQRSLKHDLEADVNIKMPESKRFLVNTFLEDLDESVELHLNNWTKFRPKLQRIVGRIFLYVKPIL
jgi:cardiolipin synthase